MGNGSLALEKAQSRVPDFYGDQDWIRLRQACHGTELQRTEVSHGHATGAGGTATSTALPFVILAEKDATERGNAMACHLSTASILGRGGKDQSASG